MRITSEMRILTTGSSHIQPVRIIMRPVATTPSEIPASAAMWRNAARTLRSSSRPLAPRSVANCFMAASIAAGLVMPCWRSNAAKPETCGAAIDVPWMK